MKFSISYIAQAGTEEPIAAALSRVADACIEAEAYGFDTFMIGEQHFTPYLVNPDSLQYFTYLAARTKRIRFCSGVIVLPHYHPIQFAERVGLLDILSEGRLDIGIGRGYQRRAYDGLGINMEDSAERFDEILEIAKLAWTSEEFTYEGKYHSVKEPIAVYPKPVQKPYPPIWVAGVSPHSLEKIGKSDYGFLKNPSDNLETSKQQVETYRAARRAAGLPEAGDRIRLDRMTVVLDDRKEAKALADDIMRRFTRLFAGATIKPPPGKSYEHYQSKQYREDRGLEGGYDFERIDAEQMFTDAEGAIERITYLRDVVGATEVSFNVGMAGMSPELISRVMRTISEKVMPAFK